MYLGLTNETGNPHQGQMNFVDNQVNPRTGTIRGRAVFDNRDGQFTPGLYARLKLVGSAQYDAMLINDEAVGTDLGKKFVLVMDKDNKATYRAVELGPKLEACASCVAAWPRMTASWSRACSACAQARRSPRKKPRWPANRPSPPSPSSARHWRPATRRRKWRATT